VWVCRDLLVSREALDHSDLLAELVTPDLPDVQELPELPVLPGYKDLLVLQVVLVR